MTTGKLNEVELRRASVFVLKSMALAADKGYRSLDTFASWFIGGTGALFGLLIANLDKLTPFVTAHEFADIVPKVVWAFGLVLTAKFFGSLICARAGSLEPAVHAPEQVPQQAELEAAYRAALPWPMRFIFALLPPEPGRMARCTVWWLMIAGLSSIAAAVLVICAWLQLARAIVP